MKSPLGRNAPFSAICFGLSASDTGQYKLNRTCFADKFASSLTADFMDQACFAYEVIAIREGQHKMMHHDFSMGQADDTLLLTWLRNFFHVFITVMQSSTYISVFFFFPSSIFNCVYL